MDILARNYIIYVKTKADILVRNYIICVKAKADILLRNCAIYVKAKGIKHVKYSCFSLRLPSPIPLPLRQAVAGDPNQSKMSPVNKFSFVSSTTTFTCKGADVAVHMREVVTWISLLNGKL